MNKPIGIFDSGVGGLSILAEIQRLLPNESFVFLADQSYVPYGGKAKSELIDRTTKISQFLIDQDVKMIVAACNTATVYTIDELRKSFSLPIVGTVPVIKTASAISKTKKVAVFSTPATASSPYLSDLITKFGEDVYFYKVGGTGLEELVENGDLGNETIQKKLDTFLTPLLEKDVDVIVLGCTHYPFLTPYIKQVVGDTISVLDSGGAVARRVQEVLKNNNALATKKGTDVYYTTKDASHFQTVAEELLQQEIRSVQKVNI